MVDVFTPANLYLGKQQYIFPETTRILRVAKRIIKGLFYHEYGRRLPPTHGVAARNLEDFSSSQQMVDLLLLTSPRNIGGGVLLNFGICPIQKMKTFRHGYFTFFRDPLFWELPMINLKTLLASKRMKLFDDFFTDLLYSKFLLSNFFDVDSSVNGFKDQQTVRSRRDSTRDLSLRRRTLYPTELREQNYFRF